MLGLQLANGCQPRPHGKDLQQWWWVDKAYTIVAPFAWSCALCFKIGLYMHNSLACSSDLAPLYRIVLLVTCQGLTRQQ